MPSKKAPPGAKFCVFCGATPSAKNREHIVPRWLLAITGGQRQGYFGRQWSSPDLKKRIYSWDAFTFPACESCNTRWAHRESIAKSTLQAMIAGAPLSAGELIDLLDWIDKVRVGLWLAMFYLNSNYRSIIPQFHIDDRVGRQDRALLIYRSSNSPQGIAMVGIDSPIFHSMPSVMGLFVNQLCFISLSKPFLLAEHFGWPTIHNARMKDVDTDGFFADVVPGSNKLAPVILDGLPAKPGTALFQPIAYIGGENSYDAPHVTQTSQQGKVGVGKLFVGNEATSLYPTEKSPTWMPSTNTSFNDLSSELTTWIASMQEKLFLDLPDFSHFPDADRIAREKEIRGIVKLHRMMVEHDVKSSSIAP